MIIKRIIVILIVCIIGLFVPANLQVFSAQNLTLDLQTESNIKPDRAFTVRTELHGSTQIGAALFRLSYDGSSLTVRSVTMEPKSREDVLQFEDADGSIAVVYSAAANLQKDRVLNIRFVPKEYYAEKSYSFIVTECSACDSEGEWLDIEQLPVLSLSVSEERSSSSQQTRTVKENKQSSSTERIKESSTKKDTSSKNESGTEASGKSETADSGAENSESLTSEASGGVIIIKEASEGYPITQTVFLCLLGSVIVVSCLAFFFYRIGKKEGEKENKKKHGNQESEEEKIENREENNDENRTE